MKTPKIVIANLDGTIALIEHRRHWLDAGRHPDMTSDELWRTFFAQCHGDLPNWPVIRTLQALQMTGYYIHIFSGRSDESQSLRHSVIASLSCRPGVISVRILAVQPHLPDQQSISVNPHIYSLSARQEGFRPW